MIYDERRGEKTPLQISVSHNLRKYESNQVVCKNKLLHIARIFIF